MEKKKTKRLSLKAETLRALSDDKILIEKDLEKVAGGFTGAITQCADCTKCLETTC